MQGCLGRTPVACVIKCRLEADFRILIYIIRDKLRWLLYGLVEIRVWEYEASPVLVGVIV